MFEQDSFEDQKYEYNFATCDIDLKESKSTEKEPYLSKSNASETVKEGWEKTAA